MKTFIIELNQNEVKLVSGGATEVNSATVAEDNDSFSEKEILFRVLVDVMVSLIMD